MSCRCHASDLYATLTVCPHCGHRSYDPVAEACERRSCGHVGEVDTTRTEEETTNA